MSVKKFRQPGEVSEQAVDYLLVSTPNLLAANRINAHLLAAGIAVSQSSLGLEVWCADLDWQAMLQSLSFTLSSCEQRDTRVAMVGASDDPAALHRAIFRAKSLDQLILEIRESWLNRVMGNNGIVIYYQPLMQFPPGRLHGYECLMRGMDGEGKLIPPTRMFEAAATLDKLLVLDERCREAALREAGRLALPDARFFINFIPSAITEPSHCLSAMLRVMEASQLAPQQVVFEVVETDKVQDKRHLLDILRSFRKAGFKVALDDVGAGYASLLALSYLRPDYIKIDGELVRLAARSSLEAKIVADLAETARQNNIIAIAEGIETEQELRVALRSGIRITQGYLHSEPKPQPLDELSIRRLIQRMQSIADEPVRGGRPA